MRKSRAAKRPLNIGKSSRTGKVRLWHNQCLPCSDFSAWIWEEAKKYFFFPVECYLQLGYKPETRLHAFIDKVEIVDGKDTDLHIDKPVYAIHLADVREL